MTMNDGDKEPEIRQLENLIQRTAKFAAFTLLPGIAKLLGKGIWSGVKFAYRKIRGKSPDKEAITDGKAEEKTASLERRNSSVKDKSRDSRQKSASQNKSKSASKDRSRSPSPKKRSMAEAIKYSKTQAVEINASKVTKEKTQGIKRTVAGPAL